MSSKDPVGLRSKTFPWGWLDILLVAVIVAVAYWGVGQMPTELERRVVEGEVYVYMLRDTGKDFETVAVRRDVPRALGVEAALKTAMEQLVMGPSPQERDSGLVTVIGDEVRVNNVSLVDGVATIDFNEELEKGVAGSATVIGIRRQIEETAKGFPDVRMVKITVDGRREAVLEP